MAPNQESNKSARIWSNGRETRERESAGVKREIIQCQKGGGPSESVRTPHSFNNLSLPDSTPIRENQTAYCPKRVNGERTSAILGAVIESGRDSTVSRESARSVLSTTDSGRRMHSWQTEQSVSLYQIHLCAQYSRMQTARQNDKLAHGYQQVNEHYTLTLTVSDQGCLVHSFLILPHQSEGQDSTRNEETEFSLGHQTARQRA